MGVISLIRAILERALSQIAGGQSCRTRMTIRPHSWTTKSPLHSSDKLHIYRRTYFLVDDTCFSFKYSATVISTHNDSFERDASLDHTL